MVISPLKIKSFFSTPTLSAAVILALTSGSALAQTGGKGAAPAGQVAPITSTSSSTSNLQPNQNRPTDAAPGTVAALPPGASKAGEDGSDAATTEINIKNADIAAVLRIFSKRTKRNYILDDRVKGKVSIYLPGKVSPDDALRILESVLNYKGFTSVPVGQNLWKIVPSREARQTTIPTITSKSDNKPSAAMVTRVISLKYVTADEMKQVITPLVSGDGLINAYQGTNSLVIIDAEDNIARVAEIVANLDVPFSNRDMTIIPIVHADAPDIAQKLNDILGMNGNSKEGDQGRASISDAALVAKSGNPNPGQPSSAVPINASIQSSGGNTASARALAPKIIADERTNSIILVADEDTTLRIRALVTQLDSKVDLSGAKFYVYRCQHAKADDLANVLSGLVGGGGSSGSKGTSKTSGGLESGDDASTGSSSRGLSGRSSQGSRTSGRLSRQSRTPGQSRTGNNRSGSGASVQLGDDLSITADPATNSLIIRGSKTDYEKVKDLLDKLDIKRRQVLVEAVILEVAISDNQTLGADFITSTGGKDGGVVMKTDFAGNLAKLLTDPVQLTNLTIAAASSGTLTLPNNIVVPTQAVLVNALEGNSDVNVLSSPNILTTDNEEAEIVVGQNVPFLASKSTSDTNLNNTFNQIDRQDVGITLRLTPQISSSDYVNLHLFTEISKVVPSSQDSTLGPTTQQRTSETTIIAKDAQMVVIGGLISDDVTQGESGIPILKDIPLLGYAFKTATENRAKINLLMFITPHIVKDQYDARELTLEQRDTMEKEIDRRGILPDRENVLRNMEMNRVTEVERFSGEKPTTITPPSDAHSAGSASDSQARIAAPAGESDTIALKVTPPLPRVPGSSVESSAAHYVILELAAKEDDLERLPFPTQSSAEKGKALAAVVVPEGSSKEAQAFFTSGQRYSYLLNGHEVSAKAIKVVTSPEEASVAASGLWYTLSPFEIVNLGKGPWKAVR